MVDEKDTHMTHPEFPKPFGGEISRFFAQSAPGELREAIDDSDKDDILNETYPYRRELSRKAYDTEMEALQIELVRMQSWVQATGQRVVVVFEGRDASGKGGTIKRVRENLNPRTARLVALPKPSDVERSQWYFQRYISHLPGAGQIVLFDRSWYNRAVVEHVFGFCTPEERALFFHQLPQFEDMLVRDGIRLFKIWLNVGQAEQLRRFLARERDPVKHWKVSRIDVEGLALWDAYTDAITETFLRSHTDTAPWTVIRSDDKKRARLATIRAVLNGLGVPDGKADAPDPQICGTPAAMGLV